MLVELFADDAVWHVPGSNAMTGEYRGRDADRRRSCAAPPSSPAARTASTLLWAVGGRRRISSPSTAPAASVTDRAPLDIEQALLVELEDGLWTVIRAQPLDQAAFDAFWATVSHARS